tara:strand:+ start:377 stop:577 length:201 start_codon:yes stop_codon:yes gene_type:complete
MAKHKSVCITLTVEEVAEAKRMTAESGGNLSEWFGMLIRKAAKKKLPPRNRSGRPVESYLESGGVR